MAANSKKSWGVRAALSAGVLIWQIHDMATATEAPSQALLILQYFLIACGLVGLIGGLAMMAKADGASA